MTSYGVLKTKKNIYILNKRKKEQHKAKQNRKEQRRKLANLQKCTSPYWKEYTIYTSTKATNH